MEGEIMVLLGSSGSGKTTSLKLVNRLIEATSGSIFFEQENILKHDPVQLRRKIGYVIQQVGLFPHMTVEGNIGTVPKLLNWPLQKIHARCIEMMKLINLDPLEYLSRLPDQLSGGQKQRIGLARALAADPHLVLMDEPFASLDPVNRKQLRSEFIQICRKLKKTIIMVTHDIAEAIDIADKICLMHAGRAQQVGTVRDMLFQPANDFASTFFENERITFDLKVMNVQDLVPFIDFDVAHGDEAPVLRSDSVLEILTANTSPSRFRLLNESFTISDLLSAYFRFRNTP